MLIRFQDTENNETLLKVNGDYTYEQIQALCIEYHQINKITCKITDMDVIEWAIRKQLMILLTDEEIKHLKSKNYPSSDK